MARTTSRDGAGVLRARPTDRHIRIDDDGNAVEVVDVRQRFGGIDVGASIAGALAALGVTVLLGAVAGSIGTVGYQMDVERGADTLSVGGLAVGFVILAAAFLVGGWVAGRIGRYDGGRNGVLAAVWFIIVAAVLGGAGAWLGDKYDAFRDLPVPQWFHDSNATTVAIVSGIAAAVIMLVAGFLGGVVGARDHARADEYLAAEERDLLTHDAPLEVVDTGTDTDRLRDDRAGARFETGEPVPVDRRDADRTIEEREIDLRRIEADEARARRDDEQRLRSADPNVAGRGPAAGADASRNSPRRAPGR
ncbi:MAG: YrzE family protein [Acidimicrobiales bacterium]